jgi:hypothetical protein
LLWRALLGGHRGDCREGRQFRLAPWSPTSCSTGRSSCFCAPVRRLAKITVVERVLCRYFTRPLLDTRYESFAVLQRYWTERTIQHSHATQHTTLLARHRCIIPAVLYTSESIIERSSYMLCGNVSFVVRMGKQLSSRDKSTSNANPAHGHWRELCAAVKVLPFES